MKAGNLRRVRLLQGDQHHVAKTVLVKTSQVFEVANQRVTGSLLECCLQLGQALLGQFLCFFVFHDEISTRNRRRSSFIPSRSHSVPHP